MKTVIFINETSHIKALARFLSGVSDEGGVSYTVIALGVDVEIALEKRNISFKSGQDLINVPHNELLIYGKKLTQDILNDPAFSFFSYRYINLMSIYIIAFQCYLSGVLYFVDIFTTLSEKYPEYKKIILFSDKEIVSDTSGVLTSFEANTVIDTARLVGEKNNIEVVVFESKALLGNLHKQSKKKFFNLKRLTFGWVLSVLNLFISTIVPVKKISILASDYWRNISPLMFKLPESEVLLLDRAESRKIKFINILKYRMRFMHIENFVSQREHKDASIQVKSFLNTWQDVESKSAVLQDAEFRDQDLAPILSTAIEKIIEDGGKRAVNIINGSYNMLSKIKPDIVWVRASVSAQIHFPVLCQVAQKLGIPSIEAQHGIFYLGCCSLVERYSAQYIATYGSFASNELKKFGYTDETLFGVGSPRFDVYKGLKSPSLTAGTKEKPITIACVVPAVLPYTWSDTYEIMDYFAGIALAVSSIPNVLVVFKLRPDTSPLHEEFYRKVAKQSLGSIPYEIAQYEPIVDVFAKSDIIISIYSTTLLEALISGRPVIYNGTLAMHNVLADGLSGYIDAKVFMMTRTKYGLRNAIELLANNPKERMLLANRASNFMKQNYSFDGNASLKLADVLRKLSHK